MAQKQELINKLQDRMGEKDKEVKELKDKIKELEDKTVHHDNQFFDVNSEIENIKMNFQLLMRRMDGMETQNTKEDGDEDVGAGNKDLERRVEALEDKTNNHEDRITELEKLLRDFESKLKDLEN